MTVLAELRDNSGKEPQAISLLLDNYFVFICILYKQLALPATVYTANKCLYAFLHFCLLHMPDGVMTIVIKETKSPKSLFA